MGIAAIRSRATAAGSFMVRRQRIFLLIALVAGVAGFTGVMLVLGRSLAAQSAAQVQADLAWRALRGARELAKTAELDVALIQEALGAHAASPDVLAIAVEVGDQVVASHGTIASLAPVFAAEPGTLVSGDGYVASWAAAVAEGTPVSKVAVVVSTRRLADARARQAHVSQLTLIAGAAAALLGAIVVWSLTPRVRIRGHAPGAGAAQDPADADDTAQGPADTTRLADQLAERTRQLDERGRDLQLVLDHAAQGFILVEPDGRMARQRSAVADRWFGDAVAEPTLAGYLSSYGDDLAAQLRLGLEGLRDGVVPPARCLAQMPKRLTAAANTFDLTYAPLMHDDKLERILVIASDVTERVTREHEEREQREQRELVALLQLVTMDRPAFDEFFAQAAGLVASLDAPGDAEVERRTLHALRDSCAYHGLETYVELCQAAEASLAETPGPISDVHRVALANSWARIAAHLAEQAP